jgi:hypothetical protein
MKLVADTSAILSLKCSRYFDIIMGEHNIVITPSVSEELQQFARYSDTLGLMANELIKKTKNNNESRFGKN